MKIKLDLDKKRISIMGEVNLEDLLIKLLDLNIKPKDYTIECETQYFNGGFVPTSLTNTAYPKSVDLSSKPTITFL